MEFYSGQHLSANCLNGLVARVNNLCNQLRSLQGRQATANLGKVYFPRRASEGGGDVGYWTRMPINLPPFTRFDVVRYGNNNDTEVESYLQGGSWVSGVEGIHTLPTVRLCKHGNPALLYIEPTEYRSSCGGTTGLGLSLYVSCSYFAFPNLQLLADERCKYACVPINQLCKVMRTEFRCGTEAQVCRMEFKKVSLRLFKQYWAGDIHRPDLYDIRKEHFGYSVDLECSSISISQGVAVLYPPVIQSGCALRCSYVYGNSEFRGCSLHPRMVLIPCATIRTSLSNSSVLTYFYRCDCSSCEKPCAWTHYIKDCHGCVIGTCTTCWTLPDPEYNYGYNWRNECKSAMYVPCWKCAGKMLQFYDFDTEVNYSGWSDPCFHACNMNIGRDGYNHPEIVPVGRFYTRTEIVYNTCGCVRTEADGSKTTEVLTEVHEWRTFCINKTPMVIYDRSLNGIGTFWRWYSDCGRERDIACVRAQYYHWATGAITCCRLVPCLWERAGSGGQCNRLAVSRVAMTSLCGGKPPQYFYVPAPKDCWYNHNTEVHDG